MTAVQVRAATATDLTGIAAIYEHQVHTGVATFDTEPPPSQAWEDKLAAATGPGLHLLVALPLDDGGAGDAGDAGVLGYASATTFRPRAAYGRTREVSVYVDPGAAGRGVGRALYDDLLARLRTEGMHTAVAVVALPNPASRALHAACGFTPIGVLREVGRKHDRWVDTEWWQLLL